MRIDQNGKVKSSEIVEGIIRSAHKMTYTQITKILEGEKETRAAFSDVCDIVEQFAELTRILQAKREKKGSVTLDVKEAKILFDKETNEITIPDYERAFSYQIIEAFMVLANETVAEYMHALDAPFVYRIHEKPNEEKATTFRAFAQTLGLNARFSAQDVKPYDYQNLLKSAQDHPAYSVLNRVMLRSMQKARYSPENVGHFGLASDCYCHFTSPIRRYPDLCIHRIIKEVLHGNYGELQSKYGEFVERAAERSSIRERLATEAERDVDDLYKTMYMSEHIDEEYTAVISGVTSFGLFAELPNTVEGFIPIETLFGNFTFDADRFRLIGKTESYTIGEEIKIKVTDVDFYRRRTEFRLLEKIRAEA
jgi:ribonuclease R